MESTAGFDAWERHLLKKAADAGHENIWNAFRPQKNFKYPDFPQLPEDLGNPYDSFRRLAFPDHPQGVRLASTLTQAVELWMREMNLEGKTIAIQHPAPHELIEAARSLQARIEWVSRDPEEIDHAPWENIDAFLLSQPSRVDGLYYPQALLESIVVKIRKRNPRIKTLSEQSNALFALNMIPPGHLPQGSGNFVVKSLFPAWSPHGAPVSWYYGTDLAERSGPERISQDEILEAMRTLLAFQSRQGAAFGEFERKILLVQKGLRMFADALKPMLLAEKCRVPLWPEAGFYLLLDVSAQLKDINTESFCEDLATRAGLVLVPGSLVKAPGQVQLCYAATPKALEDLGTRLSKALANEPSQGA